MRNADLSGYLDSMRPLLEGFWWQDGIAGIDYSDTFDDEPAIVALMDECLQENGFENDLSAERLHHEMYLSDARKVAPDK